MAAKRRKLNKEMEAEMASAQKKVELMSAKIRDIRDEDIQNEFAEAFAQVSVALNHLVDGYRVHGFCEETEGTLFLYRGLMERFEEEYEL
jgi:hypothetical protein